MRTSPRSASIEPARLWPLLATLVALGAWVLVHREVVEGGWYPALDQALFGVFLVTSTAAMIRVTTEVRRTLHAARTISVLGPGSAAEITVTDESGGRLALTAASDAGRRSLGAQARIVRDDEKAPALPSLVFFLERGNTSKLVIRSARPCRVTALEADLDVAESRRVVLSLLDGVRELHDRGHVLGDIRPGSVLVDEELKPVLVELAPPLRAAPSRRAASEVARGELPEIRDDVHALGALIYELLSKRPLPALGEPGARQPLGREVDPVLEDIVSRCLGPREERYANTAELREALERTPWRNGFVALLLHRIATEPQRADDLLDQLRAHHFLERVPLGDAGELSLGVWDEDSFEVRVTGKTVVSAALRIGANKTIATLQNGRALFLRSLIDPEEVAREGLLLVEPIGTVHDLTTANATPGAPVPTTVRGLFSRVAFLARRGRDGELAALRSVTVGALRFLSTQALLEALDLDAVQGGPYDDVRERIEEELAERALVSVQRPEVGSPLGDWLETWVRGEDPVHAYRRAASATSDTSRTLEDRVARQAAALEALADTESRVASAARRARARFAPADTAVAPVLSALGGGPLLGGCATWLSFAPVAAATRGTTVMGRSAGDLVPAVDQARALVNRVAGQGEFPQLDLAEYPGDPRDLVFPLVVAVVQARGERKPLPRQIGFAVRVDEDGKILPVGGTLMPMLEAAIDAGIRLVFVAPEDAEAARRVRGDRGIDARELAIEELPAGPLDELLRFIELRIAVHFPSVLAVEPWRARVILERARTHVVGARPDRALDQLTFLLRTLARQEDNPRLANLKPVCLADIARCRNSRGQWRLALQAYDSASEALEALRAGRKLDWLGAELLYELPNQKAACLLHAYAFDVAEPILVSNFENKRALDIVSQHSIAKSQGTLGQMYLEWAIAGESGEKRAERLKLAREHLTASYEGVDEEERSRNRNYLGHLEAYCGNFDEAQDHYDEVVALERNTTRSDRRNSLQFAELGLVLLETRRGLAGDVFGFQNAVRRGEEALENNTYQQPVKARLARFVGTALLELDRLDEARERLTDSLDIFRGIEDSSALLPALLPVIELARREAKAKDVDECERRIGEGVARATAVQRVVAGISPFAQAYVGGIAKDLEDAKKALRGKDGFAEAAKRLAAIREKIPY